MTIKPCFFMRNLVHALADGQLKGWLLKFTKFHVRTCRRCRIAFEALLNLIGRLQNARSQPDMLSDQQWASIHERWNEAERSRAP